MKGGASRTQDLLRQGKDRLMEASRESERECTKAEQRALDTILAKLETLQHRIRVRGERNP